MTLIFKQGLIRPMVIYFTKLKKERKWIQNIAQIVRKRNQ